jgi:hypothetical protein
MFQQLNKTLFPFSIPMGCSFADEGAGSGGGNKGGNADGEKSAENQVSKTDFERVSKENETLKQSVEDLRMEIMTPEYLEFLQAKDKPAEETKPAQDKGGDEDLSKLTPAQIYAKAKADAVAESNAAIKKLRDEMSKEADSKTQNEVAAFAAEHSDFEEFRPVMYGLSKDKRFANANLLTLYNASKEHVKKIRLGLTEEDKERNRRFSGEKPGGASGSFDPNKKYSADEAAQEAWKETVGSEGLPPA